MALINPLLGSNLASTGFDTTLIPNSVWLDGSADCLTKSLGSGAAQSRLIISTWVQRTQFSSTAEHAIITSIGGVSSSRANRLQFEDDKITVHLESTSAATTVYQTTAVYRDIGWYHVLLSIDGNESDAVKLYVNGVEQTISITSGSAFTGSLGSFAHSGATTMIGKYNNTVSDFYFLPGYLAQTTMIVGQSIQNSDLAVSDFLDTYTFGTNGSQFIPKADADIAALASTAGGNSFCLDFADSADLGNDISSNNNDYTATSMSSANQSTSTPSNVHSKFNPLDHDTAATITLSNGNRTLAMTTTNWKHARTSLPFPDESYCEVVLDARSLSGRMNVGLATGSYNVYSISPPNTNDSANRCVYRDDGLFLDFSDTTGTSYTSASLTDVLQVYRKGSNFYIGINGTWVNSADPDADTGAISSSIPSEDVFLFVGGYSGETYTLRTEAGEWTASNRPAAAKAVNTANQTAPDYQGIDYFNAVLHTGNASTRSITGVGFQPDLIYMKDRDNAANFSNSVTDAVRGVTQHIYTDSTRAELTSTSSQDITSFDTDGFSLAAANTNILHNANTVDYVSWNFLAGGAGSSNTDGSISSTVSVATPGHLSIGTYVGSGANATIGHGLGGAPDAYFVKNRDSAYSWAVYHKGVAADAETDYLTLNTTAAAVDDTAVWNDTAPTSSVFTVSTGLAVNQSGSGMYFIAFRSVPGVCKVGSYEGNASADGPYVSVGFKPAMVLLKWADGIDSWCIFDDVRDPDNAVGQLLNPNSNGTESTNANIKLDFLSNGFKIRGTDGKINSSSTFVYMAMADIAGGGTLPPIYGR